MQTTFRRYPLYSCSMDRESTDTKGPGIDNEWYVVNPDHFPLRDPGNLYGQK